MEGNTEETAILAFSAWTLTGNGYASEFLKQHDLLAEKKHASSFVLQPEPLKTFIILFSIFIS